MMLFANSGRRLRHSRTARDRQKRTTLQGSRRHTGMASSSLLAQPIVHSLPVGTEPCAQQGRLRSLLCCANPYP
jgi:hypothetical protein